MRAGLRGIARAAVMLLIAAGFPAAAQDAASLAIHQRLASSYPPPGAATLAPLLLPAAKRFADTSKTCAPSGLAITRTVQSSADHIAIQLIVKAHAHNIWLVTAQPRGCAATATMRFAVVEDAQAALNATLVGFGDSLTWPSLSKDAMLAAALGAASVLPKDTACAGGPPTWTDSAVTERDRDLAAPSYGVIFKGHWRETWTFAKCGNRVRVPIDFTADGDGGANYAIDANGVEPIH